MSAQEITELEKLIEAYPYCYLAHALLAKGAYMQQSTLQSNAVQKSTVYSTNRLHLERWLEDKLEPFPKEKIASTKAVDTMMDPKSYIAAIAKRSLQTSSNEKSIQQFATIEMVLKKDLHFDVTVASPSMQEEPPKDLSEKRTTLDTRFATVTLAHIMVQQKNINVQLKFIPS